GELMAQDRLDVLDLVFLACLVDVLKECGGNIHGDDFSIVPDLRSKHAREQPRSGPHIGDFHPCLEFAGCHDLVAVRGDFAALALKLLEELLEVRILKWLVDSGPNALFLGRNGSKCQQADYKSGKNQGIALHKAPPSRTIPVRSSASYTTCGSHSPL